MEGNILATTSINLNQCLAIRSVRLMDGEKDMFLSMSSYRTGNEEFRDICFPVTTEFQTQMAGALTSVYKETLTVQQDKTAQTARSSIPQVVPTGPSI